MSDNWWAERQQNKRISGLEDDLSYMSASLSQARASQNRLKAELSKVSGSMEQRLSRLTAAFDAFVEISDLRVTLSLFDAHGRVRHQTKQLLAGQSVGDVADAEGYWLAPALVALRGVADGAVDPAALSLATARDPLRAKTFHALLAATLGAHLPSFMEVVPSVTSPVPMYQRALWLLAADGFFGPVAFDHCATLLTGLAEESLADTVRSLAVPKSAGSVPRELDGGGELATALQACDRLTALRTWVTEALDAYTGEPAEAPDPLVRRSLDLLIAEGSPEELPLLARERELRAVIEGKKTASETWNSESSPAVNFLREDLSSSAPGRRALAVRACAPVLLAAAEKLVKTASTTPPDELPIRSRFGQVMITTSGPDRSTLEKAVDTAGQSAAVQSRRRQAAIGAGVVAVLFLVLAVFAGWGWVFVTAAATATAIYQGVADAGERRRAAESATRLKQSVRDDVARRVEVFAKTRRELQDRQSRVTDDMAALRVTLTTVAG